MSSLSSCLGAHISQNAGAPNTPLQTSVPLFHSSQHVGGVTENGVVQSCRLPRPSGRGSIPRTVRGSRMSLLTYRPLGGSSGFSLGGGGVH